jgi:hypothetical protein
METATFRPQPTTLRCSPLDLDVRLNIKMGLIFLSHSIRNLNYYNRQIV